MSTYNNLSLNLPTLSQPVKKPVTIKKPCQCSYHQGTMDKDKIHTIKTTAKKYKETDRNLYDKYIETIRNELKNNPQNHTTPASSNLSSSDNNNNNSSNNSTTSTTKSNKSTYICEKAMAELMNYSLNYIYGSNRTIIAGPKRILLNDNHWKELIAFYHSALSDQPGQKLFCCRLNCLHPNGQGNKISLDMLHDWQKRIKLRKADQKSREIVAKEMLIKKFCKKSIEKVTKITPKTCKNLELKLKDEELENRNNPQYHHKNNNNSIQAINNNNNNNNNQHHPSTFSQVHVNTNHLSHTINSNKQNLIRIHNLPNSMNNLTTNSQTGQTLHHQTSHQPNQIQIIQTNSPTFNMTLEEQLNNQDRLTHQLNLSPNSTNPNPTHDNLKLQYQQQQLELQKIQERQNQQRILILQNTNNSNNNLHIHSQSNQNNEHHQNNNNNNHDNTNLSDFDLLISQQNNARSNTITEFLQRQTLENDIEQQLKEQEHQNQLMTLIKLSNDNQLQIETDRRLNILQNSNNNNHPTTQTQNQYHLHNNSQHSSSNNSEIQSNISMNTSMLNNKTNLLNLNHNQILLQHKERTMIQRRRRRRSTRDKLNQLSGNLSSSDEAEEHPIHTKRNLITIANLCAFCNNEYSVSNSKYCNGCLNLQKSVKLNTNTNDIGPTLTHFNEYLNQIQNNNNNDGNNQTDTQININANYQVSPTNPNQIITIQAINNNNTESHNLNTIQIPSIQTPNAHHPTTSNNTITILNTNASTSSGCINDESNLSNISHHNLNLQVKIENEETAENIEVDVDAVSDVAENLKKHSLEDSQNQNQNKKMLRNRVECVDGNGLLDKIYYKPSQILREVVSIGGFKHRL